ncbi:MAG: hypothetical protein AAFV29_25135, partial [Myxococcota bacterium]
MGEDRRLRCQTTNTSWPTFYRGCASPCYALSAELICEKRMIRIDDAQTYLDVLKDGSLSAVARQRGIAQT